MSRESKDSRTVRRPASASSAPVASAAASKKARTPAEAVPVEIFKRQMVNEVEQIRNNIQLAVALGKNGDSEKITRKHLNSLVSHQIKRMRSYVNQFKRSVGTRRERKNLTEWSGLHQAEAKDLTPPSSEQPHLFDRRLAQLIRSQEYTIKVPREGKGATGRTVIQGSEDVTLNVGDYVRDHESHSLSTKANMRALLGLYINQVGRAGKRVGERGSSPVVDLTSAREFQALFRDAVRESNGEGRDVSDWSSVPYATAMSLMSMLDSPHTKFVKDGGKALDLPRVANLSERIKAHKRAINWVSKEKSAGRRADSTPAAVAPRAASPRSKTRR
jgi:hypothetical protein